MDMSPEEFAEAYMTARVSVEDSRGAAVNQTANLHGRQIPSAFDWGSRGVVTPVKDQVGFEWSVRDALLRYSM